MCRTQESATRNEGLAQLINLAMGADTTPSFDERSRQVMIEDGIQ